jgi:cobaltochelatase CobS
VGLGDTTGLYHGTQQINQGQMDRWNIVVATLNYLPHDARKPQIVLAKSPTYDTEAGRKKRSPPWSVADLTRRASSTATSRP